MSKRRAQGILEVENSSNKRRTRSSVLVEIQPSASVEVEGLQRTEQYDTNKPRRTKKLSDIPNNRAPKLNPSLRVGRENLNRVDKSIDIATESCSPHVELPSVLPSHLHSCLTAQKRAVLAAFNSDPSYSSIDGDESDFPANDVALQQLTDLLSGTVERGEGNSCLVIGPRGSGKSKTFERALSRFASKTIVVRLNGLVQHSDRLAIREIARQVFEQNGGKSFSNYNEGDPDDPFAVDNSDNEIEDSELNQSSSTPPASSRLPSLISRLPTFSRPVVVLLDEFHLFSGHARQALLYCLLDTVQSCRAGGENNRGLAVVGLTPRVDAVNLLEKRVKSRFSHRMMRTLGVRTVEDCKIFLKNRLCFTLNSQHGDDVCDMDSERRGLRDVAAEWRRLWTHSVDQFLEERAVKECLQHSFGISRDMRMLITMMTASVVDLTPTSPFLTVEKFLSQEACQRSPARFPVLSKLRYPFVSLLIAAAHVRTAGHDTFTFEMLHNAFRNQVRASSAAPVVVEGGGIGMVNVSRDVLMAAFEYLAKVRIFLPVGSSVPGAAKEFIKHRCEIERDDIKAAVEKIGHTNLKKWLNKAE